MTPGPLFLSTCDGFQYAGLMKTAKSTNIGLDLGIPSITIICLDPHGAPGLTHVYKTEPPGSATLLLYHGLRGPLVLWNGLPGAGTSYYSTTCYYNTVQGFALLTIEQLWLSRVGVLDTMYTIVIHASWIFI